ncbi:MAG: hypothetical protein KAW00_05820 [Dehalococcoidia bacterium]|nr:hypothetical protein [Dehalococcoidia bacterium]
MSSYSDQSLVAVGRLIRETCLMAGIWETRRMTSADTGDFPPSSSGYVNAVALRLSTLGGGISFCNFSQGLVCIILEGIWGIAAFPFYYACVKRCDTFEVFSLGVGMSSVSAFRKIPPDTREQARRWARRPDRGYWLPGHGL